MGAELKAVRVVAGAGGGVCACAACERTRPCGSEVGQGDEGVYLDIPILFAGRFL
jgi:hypothetical protein